MNECKYCNWWNIAHHDGRLCVKCGKRFNYVPPLVNPFPTMEEVWNNTEKSYAEYFQVLPDQVHNWFGLSYASYLVLPRAILQHMPDEWQTRLVQLLGELEDVVDFNDNDAVNLRDKKGKFIKDPLSQYRRFPKDKVPWKK